MIPILPLALVIGLGGAYASKKMRGKKGLTPERKVIYETALEEMTDSGQLNMLADAFEAEGLKVQAQTLRKRAGFRDAPISLKRSWQDAYRRGMGSTNPKAVRSLADAFDKQGVFITARDLRKYADGLDASQTQGGSDTQQAGQDESIQNEG